MGNKSEISYFLSIKKVVFYMVALVVIISSIAVTYNQKAINKEMEKYLYELSIQSKSKINTRIDSNFSILYSIKRYIKDKKMSEDEIRDYIKYLKHCYPFDWIGYVDANGDAVISNGERENFLKHPVIKRALEGKGGISNNIKNIFGEDGILYTVPCDSANKGVIVGFTPAFTLKRLLSSESFSGEGFSHIINRDGDFILKAENKNSKTKGSNFFDNLKTIEINNGSLKEIEKDISEGKTGNINFVLESIKFTLNYMPLKNGEWYVLSIVPTAVYSSQLLSYTRYNLAIIFVSMLVFLGMFICILKLTSKKNEEISKIAYEDPITKGFTSARFEIDVRKRLTEKEFKPFTLVSLDIRKFKLINESFGEEKGNFVLRYVHDCIKRSLGKNESVSRISSDTFNILLDSIDESEIKCKMKNLSALINEFNTDVETPYYLSIDCGAYIVKNENLNVIVIRDRANHARKNSKNSSNTELFYNCVFYNNIEIENSLKEKNIEDNMERALENNEFVVYLQPKVEIKSNKIAGAEALVRWLDPKKGIIPPLEFIPIFEKNGFIGKLDIYVFEEVCKMIRNWLDEGTNPVPVSVNLSRMHLQNPHFLKKYKEIQMKYNIPADLLEIELTETMVFENFEHLKKIIDEIHQMGFYCSIDDFGSGYSSLNLLKEIPVDILKLDRVFFSKENDERGNNVIESIISLAKKLNMTTISEGVETISQVDFLKKINCDLVQGYVFSKPLNRDSFEKNFLKNKDIKVKKYENPKV
ncbi:EAL domain-containing protein [Fusobacterium ulcerans]|uniref:bifunctional diguanylate cyclase/phosphodiesterase n=1 Tax=Fusobacterium ulcerans TaxID=861 RepID=UPI002E7658A1|nr:EAL domain-containing protein [Fusobacterium ulcerans]MEE0139398.1 EAL domain-containing protein [Fusobacterium ulcerans]